MLKADGGALLLDLDGTIVEEPARVAPWQMLLAGAALATWGLSRWEAGARFFGVTPRQPLQVVRQVPPHPVGEDAPAHKGGAP